MLTMSQQHFGPTSINSATGHHLLLLSVLLAFFHQYCTDISVRPKPTLLGGRVLLYLRYFLCGPLSYRACVCVLIDVCVQRLLYMFRGQHKIIPQHSRSKSSTKPPSPFLTCQFKMATPLLFSRHPIPSAIAKYTPYEPYTTCLTDHSNPPFFTTALTRLRQLKTLSGKNA